VLNLENYNRIVEELIPYDAHLIAVSKTKPFEEIRKLFHYGQKYFGENYVQELISKHSILPEVQWHFIGHLQRNKVKQIIPFVSLIHGVDSLKLLEEINKEAAKINRIQDCLIEIFIAKEETKSGLTPEEAIQILSGKEITGLKNISIRGLMGMATNTKDESIIRSEFKMLRNLFDEYNRDDFNILSMGMTSDYKIALEEGSTMVRIGSAIFGERAG